MESPCDNKILVVDDEGIVLDSCRRVLEAEGFEVSLVASAERALQVLADQSFVLLLVDVKMPEHDGMYLMQRVKERCSEIPMIAMSGYHTGEIIAEARKRGATAFLAKPFTPYELLATIRQVIRKGVKHGEEKSLGH
jgi:DNA-binding NtrC family response regulator